MFINFTNGLVELWFYIQGGFQMGTVIGLLILIAIDWYLLRKTGLHIHKFISKKYAEYLQSKEKDK